MQIIPVFSGRTQKESESLTDCQDYFSENVENGSFAIADGASQSFYPSIWAELLVKRFCQNPVIDQENWRDWLKPVQQLWLKEVEERVRQAKAENRPTWIEGQNGLNAQRSATSTFIGLHFTQEEAKVCIIGDSCLFVLENNQVKTHLLKSSADFNDRPEYFASYVKDNHFQPTSFTISLEKKTSETMQEVYFILATDALSEYIFRCLENNIDIFQPLLQISSQSDFKAFVASARSSNLVRMKNDDVGLMVLNLIGDTKHMGKLPKELGTQFKLYQEIQSNSKPEISQLTNNREEHSEKENLIPFIAKKVLSPFKRQESSSHSNSKKPAQSDIRNLAAKEIQSLKQQRAILGILVFLLSFFTLINTINRSKIDENDLNDVKTLPEGEKIYQNQELGKILMPSLSREVTVFILDEGENWIRFQIDVYAWESEISPCLGCSEREIEIKSKATLRILPGQNFNDVLGQLAEETKFEKIGRSSKANWYKIKFVGYAKK